MAINDAQPSLDDLSVFLAVLDAGGFRAAAGRLRLAPSTISEKISQLEAQLGVPLLHRTTRSVLATEAGSTLAARLAPLWAETRAALQDAYNSQLEVRGFLRLNVPGAVMVDILPPLIDCFLVAHPAVSVEVMVDDRLVDIVAAGCDAGIRYGEHLAQDMIAVPLGPLVQSVGYAASPQYLRARGNPTHPSDLLNHDCIRLRFTSGAFVPWDFEKGKETLRVDPPGRLVIGVDAVGAAVRLASTGRGVIGTFANWLQPYFETGELAPVLQEWWQPFDGPRLYFSRRFMPAPLRAFVEMIRAERE